MPANCWMNLPIRPVTARAYARPPPHRSHLPRTAIPLTIGSSSGSSTSVLALKAQNVPSNCSRRLWPRSKGC